jgi:hypothetical protein
MPATRLAGGQERFGLAMFEKPTKFDIDRNLSVLMHESRRKPEADKAHG